MTLSTQLEARGLNSTPRARKNHEGFQTGKWPPLSKGFQSYLRLLCGGGPGGGTKEGSEQQGYLSCTGRRQLRPGGGGSGAGEDQPGVWSQRDRRGGSQEDPQIRGVSAVGQAVACSLRGGPTRGKRLWSEWRRTVLGSQAPQWARHGTGCTGLGFREHAGLGMETWLAGACEALGHMSPGVEHSRGEKVPARGLARQGFEAPEQGLKTACYRKNGNVNAGLSPSPVPGASLLSDALPHPGAREGWDWQASWAQHSTWS